MAKTYSRVGPDGRVIIDDRILRYLATWPSGLSTDRMGAWIHSCSKAGGYSEKEYQTSLYRLRDAGSIAIANGIWYVRKQLR